jgi:hypothetical protein
MEKNKRIIFLYIKTHKVTGLKYFGKTTKKDPESYIGSGKYWLRHVKIHGRSIDTEIVGEFTCQEECTKFAIEFSIKNNIVESSEWANLIIENGLSGAPLYNKISKETRDKISKTLTGKTFPKSKYVIKECAEKRKARYREMTIGRRWIHRQNETKKIKTEDPIPDGWKLGRPITWNYNSNFFLTNKHGNNTRGKKIYNDGKTHRYYFLNQQPEGWRPGKMPGYQGGTGADKKNRKSNKGK